jgi:hypothetical protein
MFSSNANMETATGGKMHHMRFRKAKTTWIQGRFVDMTTGELHKVDRRAFI